MKYLKIYEDFISEPKIEDYDYSYFFEEITDDFDVYVDSDIEYNDDLFPAFVFLIEGKDIDKVDDFSEYDSTEKRHIKNKEKILSKLGDLEQPFKKIVERVELLNGKIIISNTTYFLIYLSISALDMFKNKT